MDYMVLIEKILKYFDLSLESENKILLFKIKQQFKNDLNLFGCFIKDFLIIKNPEKTIQDNYLYSDFVLYFEQFTTQNEKQQALMELSKYSEYYMDIVFEKAQNQTLESTMCVINSCFALDCYPYLMMLMNDFDNEIIDSNSFIMMLKSISDTILNRFENSENLNLDFKETKIANKILNNKERLAS